MGYMRHHAIIVTGCLDGYVERAFARAASLGMKPTPISAETTNGYRSFLVPPDGSKERWDESDEGDSKRERLIVFLNSLRYDDKSSPVDWIEVQFGDDERVSKVTRHSDEQRIES